MKDIPEAIAAKLPLAAALVASRGLDQVKSGELAEATGIPKATLYYYFSGKEQILSFLLSNWLETLREYTQEALEGEGTAQERLQELIRAQLVAMAADSDVCRALFFELGRFSRIPQLMEALSVAYYQPVILLLQQGAEDGSLRPVADPASAAVAIFGAVSISALARLLTGEELPAENVATQVAMVVLDGVGITQPKKPARRSPAPQRNGRSARA